MVAAASEWHAAGPAENGRPIQRPPIAAPAPRPVASGALRVSYRRLSQGNLCLGMPGVSRDDPDRWALDLLGAILGDGMGSRLFLELRERRSLVYDISTFSATYADAGTFGVHAGFDPAEARLVVNAILEQLDRITTDLVRPEELDRARAYTRVASSFGWRTRVRSPAGSARARPCCPGSSRSRRSSSAWKLSPPTTCCASAALPGAVRGSPRGPRAIPIAPSVRDRPARVTDEPPPEPSVIDVIADELTLARAQLDAGQPGLAEGTVRRRLARLEADGREGSVTEADALNLLLAECLWRQQRPVAARTALDAMRVGSPQRRLPMALLIDAETLAAAGEADRAAGVAGAAAGGDRDRRGACPAWRRPGAAGVAAAG